MYLRKNYGDLSLNINGYTISGVQSFDGSYRLPNNNVLALGGGVYRATDENVVGDISFTKKVVGEDNLFSLISGIVTGHLYYQTGYFGFSKAYINSYSAAAQVLDIPTVDINMTAFGQVGSGVAAPSVASPVAWIRQSVLPGDIILSIDGQEATNRVQSFSYAVNIGRRPRYNLGDKQPSQVLVNWPIEVETTFSIEVDDYQFQEISGAVCNPRQKDLILTLRECGTLDTVMQFKAPKSKLLGEAVTTAIGSNMRVTATYQAYYNQFSELL